MKKLPMINVSIDKTPPVDGKEYYFLVGDDPKKMTVSLGTCTRCDHCNKPCTTNSVGIISFGSGVSDVTINKDLINAEEIGGYDERDDRVKCNDCYDKLKEQV